MNTKYNKPEYRYGGEMLEQAQARTVELQQKLAEENIDLVILTDEDSISYYGGFWGYLGVEFGRPTMMIIPKDAEPVVITPLMEMEMVSEMTWIGDVQPWEDAGKNGWAEILGQCLALNGARSGWEPLRCPPLGTEGMAIGWEPLRCPALVSSFLTAHVDPRRMIDVSSLIGQQRMIKSPDEIAVMRKAGEIAASMVQGARDAMAMGVPEYEIALAVINEGTRKAAGFLSDKGWESFVSPMIHNLQILQSGCHTSKVHRRANTRSLEAGDPVYLCFCNMASFKQYKLGFDRQFFIGHVEDEMALAYEKTVAAQQTALAQIRSGAVAEDVAAAANAVYEEAGYSAGYRTGRSIGVSYLEAPELKIGDKTVLQSGMTFAVDGGITVENRYGARIGDSIVVTDEGFEYLTDYPRDLAVVC